MVLSIYIKLLCTFIDLHDVTHHSIADDLHILISAPLDKICKLLYVIMYNGRQSMKNFQHT